MKKKGDTIVGSELGSCCSTGKVKQQPVSVRGLPYHGKQRSFPWVTTQGQEASRQALLLGLCGFGERSRYGTGEAQGWELP